jgi:hypothetical protein
MQLRFLFQIRIITLIGRFIANTIGSGYLLWCAVRRLFIFPPCVNPFLHIAQGDRAPLCDLRCVCGWEPPVNISYPQCTENLFPAV